MFRLSYYPLEYLYVHEALPVCLPKRRKVVYFFKASFVFHILKPSEDIEGLEARINIEHRVDDLMLSVLLFLGYIGIVICNSNIH